MLDPSEFSLIAVPVAVIAAGCWIVWLFRRFRFVGIVFAGFVARRFSEFGGETTVEIRPRWSPFARVVFESGDFNPGEIQLAWLSWSHLVIKYPQRTMADRFRRLGDTPRVAVTCAPLENGPAARPSTNTAPPLACSSGF